MVLYTSILCFLTGELALLLALLYCIAFLGLFVDLLALFLFFYTGILCLFFFWSSCLEHLWSAVSNKKIKKVSKCALDLKLTKGAKVGVISVTRENTLAMSSLP